MGCYRKKPVVVEAMQLPPVDEDPTQELVDFLHSMPCDWEGERHGEIVIHTLEGTMSAGPGDWIIKGVKGEFYPCKNDIFEATYEPADPEQGRG